MKILRYSCFFVLALVIVSCSNWPDTPGSDTTFYQVSVSVAPDGAGTIAPAADSSYQAGSSISLQASPGDGFAFTGWTGDVDTSANPLSLTVDRDYNLTANFIDIDELFFLHENGVTIMCPDAKPGWKGVVNGTEYEAVDRALLEQKRNNGVDLSTLCTSPVTDMSSIFAGKEDFNQDIGSWDVSNVTDMSRMFSAGISGEPPLSFNRDISHWDVSNVTNMSLMFHGAEKFNQDIGSWDVSNVTDMSSMFFGAENFDQDLNDWNVSSVTDMSSMFAGDDAHGGSGITNFNGAIGGWDVSNVTDMDGMFRDATSFNSDIGAWNVSNVTSMSVMFENASSFNQDLSRWCVRNITEEPYCFSCGSPLTEEHHPVWGTCP